VRRRFDEVYKKLYGRTYPESPVEFINFKVRASLPERLLRLPKATKKNRIFQRCDKRANARHTLELLKILSPTLFMTGTNYIRMQSFKALQSLKKENQRLLLAKMRLSL